MSATPLDFFNSAESMAAGGQKDEMTLRNILSRSYYGAYHRACEFVVPSPCTERGGMHREYIEKLMQHDKSSTERKIGEKLKSMYARRLLADYHLQENIRHDAVPVQLSSMRSLFQLIEGAPKQ